MAATTVTTDRTANAAPPVQQSSLDSLWDSALGLEALLVSMTGDGFAAFARSSADQQHQLLYLASRLASQTVQAARQVEVDVSAAESAGR